ncbi:MAG: hypothetical protein IKA36_00565 [Clostridia bacterium]|nr:hypothetical protein [Clostridia bacterium]
MAITPEEQARRDHNAEIDRQNKKYKDEKRENLKEVSRLESDIITQVPMKILNIIKSIIKTQNKGVPLSSFQTNMLNRLYESFGALDSDEKKKPIITEHEDGSMWIKDFHVLGSDGKTNLMDIQIPDAYKNQVMTTVLPLGDNTDEIIKMITDTLSENAVLVEKLNKERKAEQTEESLNNKTIDDRKKLDKFENKIEDIKEMIGDRDNKSINLLNSVANEYKNSNIFTIYGDGDQKWMGNVPIINHGDEENVSKKSKRAKASTSRNEMFKIDGKFPTDVDFVKMLPKSVTEQLIEVLSRVITENSKLHNELYKKQNKIHRKLSPKMIALIVAALLAVGLSIGAIANIFNDNSYEKTTITPGNNIEDTRGDETEVGKEDLKEVDVSNIVNYLNYFKEEYLDVVNRGQVLGDKADEVIAEEYEEYKSIIENKYKSSLGDITKDGSPSYAKMTENINETGDKLIDDVRNFFNSLNIKNYVGETSVEDYREQYFEDGYWRNGTFEDFRSLKVKMNKEQQNMYESLYTRATNLYHATYNIDNWVRDNSIYLDITQSLGIKETEKENEISKEAIALYITLASLGGAGVGAFLGKYLPLMLKNAKKKNEKLLEDEKKNEEEDIKGV